MSKERHYLTQRKAYELYEKRGYLPGDDLADCFEAERLVEEEIKRSWENLNKNYWERRRYVKEAILSCLQ